MANGWSAFGTALSQILGSAATANPNLLPQIITAATSAANPNAAAEDQALAQAEALFAVNATLALKSIEKAIGLIPTSYLGVTIGLSAIKADTPPLQAVQAIEIARAALKKAPGA